MPCRHSPRFAAARRATAERVEESTALLRDGVPLTEPARDALVDLLEHLAHACELVPTTVWDATARLAIRVAEPHKAPLPDRPPNLGGGDPPCVDKGP
jgi:hypothetical protein